MVGETPKGGKQEKNVMGVLILTANTKGRLIRGLPRSQREGKAQNFNRLGLKRHEKRGVAPKSVSR